MTNTQRADRARQALSYYLEEGDDIQQAVSDLLTDAAHLMALEESNTLDWQAACLVAEVNYTAELDD